MEKWWYQSAYYVLVGEWGRERRVTVITFCAYWLAHTNPIFVWDRGGNFEGQKPFTGTYNSLLVCRKKNGVRRIFSHLNPPGPANWRTCIYIFLMYVAWCSRRSMAKTRPNPFKLVSIFVLVDKLWAGLVSYKDERMSKLYRKVPKYPSQSFSIVRPRSKQHKRFIKELFSHVYES